MPTNMSRPYDLSTLSIKKAIVHDIPKHKKDDFSKDPIFSSQESELSERLKLFFQDSIVKALSKDNSYKISYKEDSTSPVQTQINTIITSTPDDFVNQSQHIGQHLFNIQKGNNASGILFIIKALLSGKNVCILMKLERDSGAQLTLNPKTKSFDISEVEDLMLTSKTKIFKIALLFKRDDYHCDYDGDITDYQQNIKQKRAINSFFIDDFLGCRAYADPKVTTQNFYNLTTTFIDSRIVDPIKQAEYHQHLNSYLQRNITTLNPKEFANEYLSEALEQDEYKAFLETERFEFRAFPKDLTLIKTRIEKFVVSFQNGISIVGNKGTFEDKVELNELSNGNHQAVITSRIKKIQ